MKILIPLAGFGTRMRPHTWSKPKPLVPAAGKAVLGHVLDMFTPLPEIEEVIFIVGYLGDQVREYVSEHYPHLNARYVVQEEMLGQSHAIWLAREGLEGPLLMAFVDTIIETDLSLLPEESAEAVAWVKEVDDPRRFGVADLDEDGWVDRIIEKPEDMSINLAVVGFYYFQQAERLIDAIQQQIDGGAMLKGEFYLADAINLMLQEGLKMRVEQVEVWVDCGTPEALLQTNRYLLDNGRDNTAEASGREDVLIIPPVFIDPSAEISNSVIGPYTSIGAHCVVDRSVIQDSVIDEGAEIQTSILEESLIGKEARVRGRSRSLNIGDTTEAQGL